MKPWSSALLSILFIFASVTAFSQRQITARVVDKETKTPLKGASIRIVGTDITTTTNAMVFFQLTIDSLKDLIIANPGYDTGWATVPETDKFLISLAKLTVQPENLMVKADDSDPIFMVVDEPAKFTGGLPAMSEFLVANLHYPKEARQQGIQGRVLVSFVIEKSGAIDQEEVTVVGKVHLGLDAEAARLIKSFPNWIPGKVNGQAVRSRFVLPISFKLEK